MKWSLLLFGLVAVAGTAAACEGLSPGDLLETSEGYCTLGFLVADRNGLYFTTAGHCIQVDQAAGSPEAGEFGTGAFHFLDPETGSVSDGSPGNDFALIRIHEDAYELLNPKMCGWEGPTGIYNDTPGEGTLNLYGHSLIFGDAGDLGFPTYRREGLLVENDGDAFYFVAPSLMGDSGSAVLHEDGRAMGVLTHLQIQVGGMSTNGGTHLERGFRLAAEEGFTELRLVLMGEDPVAVLAQMRGAPLTPETPVATTPTGGSNATSPSRPAPSATPPGTTNGTGPANDSIQPAATDADGESGTPNETPFVPPVVLALALTLAVALRRRRSL